MLLVELEDLAQLAVGGYDHLVTAGEVQVGQAAKVHTHGAVNTCLLYTSDAADD